MEFHMRAASSLATAVLLFMNAPAASNLQPANQTIVVRGTLLSPEQARQRAVDFVKSTGVANGQKQVARWVVPVCIKVIGVSTPQEARVVGQMLAVAREAQVPVAKVDCEPNLTVSFTADAGQVVRQIHSKKPHQFRELGNAERERLLNGRAPVRWWYATKMLDREGMQANNVSPGWIGTGGTSSGGGESNNSNGMVSLDGGDFMSTNQYNSGSHVRTPTVRSLYGATVVVDAPVAGNTSIDSIAAYAAMVAFAEMDADAPPPDSILGLFQPSSVESSLTDWDMAFLKSLYRMPLDRRSRIQRGHLVEALLDERLANESDIGKR
jgi:hypothetical protein